MRQLRSRSNANGPHIDREGHDVLCFDAHAGEIRSRGDKFIVDQVFQVAHAVNQGGGPRFLSSDGAVFFVESSQLGLESGKISASCRERAGDPRRLFDGRRVLVRRDNLYRRDLEMGGEFPFTLCELLLDPASMFRFKLGLEGDHSAVEGSQFVLRKLDCALYFLAEGSQQAVQSGRTESFDIGHMRKDGLL